MGRVVGAEGAGDGVAFAAGDGLIAGELLGLAADEDDFFVAANAVSGPHMARAAIQVSRVLSLFFMGWDGGEVLVLASLATRRNADMKRAFL